jgi:triosephosphate isomerase
MVGESRGNKSLFASFSSEKEESSFFEKKKQKNFYVFVLFERLGIAAMGQRSTVAAAKDVSMRQLIAGNWKMNGLTEAAALLADALADTATLLSCDLLVCPPFTQIAAVAARLRGSPIAVGGQDCHTVAAGAHTGDISAEMLADLGCRAVILGHSERRQSHHETDALVHAKTLAASRAGLTPIVCVGETEAERDAGRHFDIVAQQVAASLPDGFAGIVAYEPIWAIGTGRIPHAEDVIAMHAHIRAALRGRLGEAGATPRILYGGSVKVENAAMLLGLAEVGGALVGGASLQAEQFLGIARAASGG